MSATPASWWVYILRCGDGSLYTGCTNDLERRVAKHASGRGAAYTRSRLPVRVVFQEPASDRSAALRREAAIKRLSRMEKLAMLPKRAKREAAGSRSVKRPLPKRDRAAWRPLQRAALKRDSAGPKLRKAKGR